MSSILDFSDLPAGWPGYLVGLGTIIAVVLRFFTNRQKINDAFEISTSKLLISRVEKVEADATETRKLHEQCLDENATMREQIARLQLSVDHLQGSAQVYSAVGLVAADHDGTIREVNRGVTLILGWAEGELIGQPVHRLVPHRLRGEHEERFSSAVKRGEAHSKRDTFGLTRDGGEVPITLELSSMKLPEGRVMFTAQFRRKVS